MGKILFLCNSVYQLLFALNLRMTVFKEDNVDFVISDQMNGSEGLTDRIRQNIDNSNVYNLRIKESLCHENGKLAYAREIVRIRKAISKLDIEKHAYSSFGFANLDPITSMLFEYISNSYCNCFIIEDGIATYSRSFWDQFIKEKNRKRYARLINEVWLIRDNIVNEIGLKQIKAPIFNVNDKSLIEKYNKIFGYYENRDIYDKRIIFFEESYYVDKGIRDDETVINFLEKKYGKDNIMIKIHPRNRENRFEKMGYKTNKNTAIPWELIILNENISDKILCTMMSGAVITPWMMGIKSEVIMFYNCVDRSAISSHFLPTVEKICKENKDIFYVPETFEMFLKMENIR